MKINVLMPDGLKQYFKVEMNTYDRYKKNLHFSRAWTALERAHILGQSYPVEHSKIHWLMLKEGFRRRNVKEIFGQLIRLLTGGFKSFINAVPIGNTGGANVPPLRKMEIPDDLKHILSQYQ